MTASFIYCPTHHLPTFRKPWQGPNHLRTDVLEKGEGLPAFRRTFRCETKPECVQIEATALGIFELYCNGERVGIKTADGTVYDELKPGNTDFRRRVYTYFYDLTPYLRVDNTLVAVVAPGWWSGNISFGAFGLKPLCFAASLSILYPNGTREQIETDGEWTCAVCGPTITADLYDGERTDARLPHPFSPYAPYQWEKAEIYKDYSGKVEPRLGPPVRLRPDLTLHPQSATVWRNIVDNGTKYGAIKPRMKRVGSGCESMTLYAGEHLILDFAQNAVGRPSITMNAPAGVEMHVLFAEMLNDSGSLERGNDGAAGTLYVANYRSAHARLEYITRGGAPETYTPLFSFFGYRYLDITVTDTVEIISVNGEIVTSEMAEVSAISTDNEEINRLISNIRWGRRSNYLHIPTDCPQRDERLGWTGDAHIFCGAAAYLCDIRAFMRKWLCDARDAQEILGGAYADVIPHVLPDNFSGNAGWGDAPIIIPDYLWQMYGDTDILREHYSSMERYMEYLAQFGYDGAGLAYGDWLAYELTNKRYIAVCYYAADAQYLEKYSRILSERAGDFYDQRATYYKALTEKIRASFSERYVKEGMLTEQSQTAYLLALRYEMVTGDVYSAVAEALCKKIEDNSYTLSTGFIGTGILAQTLAQIGRDDLVYSLLLQTRDPSWLYSVRQGATTVWERWNSYTLEKGFGDVSMNSFNHYAYGAILEWLYARAAGISPDQTAPGFTHLILAPKPDLRDVTTLPDGQKPILCVRAYYDSIAGKIKSEWHYEDGQFVWKFEVPAGITATIQFPLLQNRKPCQTRETVQINGVIYTAGELCAVKRDGVLEFELGAGNYEMR